MSGGAAISAAKPRSTWFAQTCIIPLEDPSVIFRRSPLARGRGLEHDPSRLAMPIARSPLARGRGLEPPTACANTPRPWSPLARGRGLEHLGDARRPIDPRRPSRGGVDWNFGASSKWPKPPVAPRAGAWIGTSAPSTGTIGRWSPLARGRGLERTSDSQIHFVPGRPSRGGVDWNLVSNDAEGDAWRSPLARGRGLERRLLPRLNRQAGSPLARGRGLEHARGCLGRRHRRSPLARGRGLEHLPIEGPGIKIPSPLARGRGLEHEPRRRHRRPARVAPRAGAWI